jgi:glutathione S-transferase
LLKASGSQYVAGDNFSIADLQYFFELTNMIVYEKSFSQYKLITSWYNRVAEVPEVRALHQQWAEERAPKVTQTLKSATILEQAKL